MMIRDIILDAHECKITNDRKFHLTMDIDQLKALRADLDKLLAPPPTWNSELQEARKFFFEKEGYMETDDTCWAYWKEHKDESK